MEEMNKRTRSFHPTAEILGIFLAVSMLCLLSCNSNKRHTSVILPIGIPEGEPMDEGPLWPPEKRSVHEIYDSLMQVYSETDSNRVINDPGSILVEAMEIESLRNKTE